MSSLAERKERLIVRSDDPCNAEPPPARLRAAYRTASEDFHVRSDGDLPEIGGHGHRLAIDGEVLPRWTCPSTICARFPRVTVTATMRCAGLCEPAARFDHAGKAEV